MRSLQGQFDFYESKIQNMIFDIFHSGLPRHRYNVKNSEFPYKPINVR